jgi:HTH-type transcriptional regulator/antitoxin HigA
MNKTTQRAVEHWPDIAPLLKTPKDEETYDWAIKQLDELLDITAGEQDHPLNDLIDLMGERIALYESESLPEMTSSGAGALAELMRLHGLKQKDLSHIASQGVISEILNGKRSLSRNQIKLLAAHFNVSPMTFWDPI